MIRRCYNKNGDEYSDYGGRGIEVYEEWRLSFEAFYEYVGKRPSPRHSLDRYPNNNGNYEPGNVRWASSAQQGSNKRNNAFVSYNGERVTMTEAARRSGVCRITAIKRRERGWPESDWFLPARNQNKS